MPQPLSRPLQIRFTGCTAVLAVVAALAALAAHGLQAGQVSKPENLSHGARTVIHPTPAAEMETLARTDPLDFLRTSLQWYEKTVSGYRCTFQKQEVVDGKLQKIETMAMKFCENPFRVYLKWTRNPGKGREVIYWDGKYDDKAVVHPDGLIGIIFRKVSLDPEGKTALKHSRRSLRHAGMANMLRVIIPQCQEAQTNGDLRLEYLGVRTEAGRPTYVFNRILPDGKGYTAFQCFIYIDQQFLVPVRTEAYDWQGRLISDYRYTDFEMNPGLTNDDFDPDNPDYEYNLF